MGELAQTLLQLDALRDQRKFRKQELEIANKAEARLGRNLDEVVNQFSRSMQFNERQLAVQEDQFDKQFGLSERKEKRESRSQRFQNEYIQAQARYMNALSDVAADTMLKDAQKQLVNQQAALTKEEARGLKMKYDYWEQALGSDDENLKTAVKNEMFGIDMSKQMDDRFKQMDIAIKQQSAFIDALNYQRQSDQDNFNRITGLLSGLLGAETQAALRDIYGKSGAKNITSNVTKGALGSGEAGAPIPILNLQDPNTLSNIMNQFLGGE